MVFDKFKTSHKLEQILLNFIDVLRINILVVDSQGKPVLVPTTGNYGFYGSSQWGVLKYIGKMDFYSKFQIEGNYLKAVDSFGFQTFAIPISIQGLDPIGYLIVGPVILNRQYEHSRYKVIVESQNLDFSEFLGYLNEIRVVSFNSLKSILDLLFELSQYALRMNDEEKPQLKVKNDEIQAAHSVFTILLDLAMALSQAECGSVMLLNKITNELTIEIYKGIDLQDYQNVAIKLGEGIAGLSAKRKESFVINEEHSTNRIRHLLKKPELKCALILPILNKNKEVLGVMNISTIHGTSRLATHSQQILKNIAEITSKACQSL